MTPKAPQTVEEALSSFAKYIRHHSRTGLGGGGLPQDEVLKAIEDLVSSIIPEDSEPDFYREAIKQRRWMCRTCYSDVFGGICECYSGNLRNAGQRIALSKVMKG